MAELCLITRLMPRLPAARRLAAMKWFQLYVLDSPNVSSAMLRQDDQWLDLVPMRNYTSWVRHRPNLRYAFRSAILGFSRTLVPASSPETESDGSPPVPSFSEWSVDVSDCSPLAVSGSGASQTQ